MPIINKHYLVMKSSDFHANNESCCQSILLSIVCFRQNMTCFISSRRYLLYLAICKITSSIDFHICSKMHALLEKYVLSLCFYASSVVRYSQMGAYLTGDVSVLRLSYRW